MQSNFIIGFGEALVDILPSGEVVGGAPLNLSIRAAELCTDSILQTRFISRIGADDRGERILERVSQSPLPASEIQVDGVHQTGYVQVTIADGSPSYEIAENVAWDFISYDQSVADLAAAAAVVYFGTLAQRSAPSRHALHRLLEAATQSVKILDINFREPRPTTEVVESSLQAANILKCNESELTMIAEELQLDDRVNPVDIAKELQQKYQLACVFWTQGDRGCCWQDGSVRIEGDVPQLEASPLADSVGAGDAATAALAFGVASNWRPERIVYAANLCGAFAASTRGPTEPMPRSILERIFQ